jgi:enoyl-CoA hydratase/carnithine racemase
VTYEALEVDGAVRAVVATGAGPARCAGADRSALRAATDGAVDRVREACGA